MDRLRAFVLVHHLILIECARAERAKREARMARDLASLEMALGMFESDMDKEAEKVFDSMDAVRAKAGDVFKRTQARVASSAATVDRVDKMVSSLDRANSAQNPSLGGSLNGSGNSSGTTTQPPVTPPPPPAPVSDLAEKKT